MSGTSKPLMKPVIRMPKNAKAESEIPEGVENLVILLQTTDISLDAVLMKDKEQRIDDEKDICWFHENTSRNLAEYKLKDAGNVTGMFLIRDSVGTPGDFVLSLVCDQMSHHYQIHQTGFGTFNIGSGQVYHGVDQLVEAYQECAAGLPTPLLTPCPGDPPPPFSRAAGYTNLLHRTIGLGDAGMAMKILAHKLCPDINAKDDKGSTALHEACHRGMEGVVRRLLDKGASVVLTDRQGWTPLQRACMSDQACVIHPLIVKGRADPQDRNLDTGCVALHESARRGHIDCVKTLLSLNAPAWPRDNDGVAAYEMAVAAGHHLCAKVIANHKPYPVTTSINDWFHADIDRQAATLLLQEHGLRDGLFIIRKSVRHKGSFVLVMTFDLHPYNYEIKCIDSTTYVIDEGPLLPSLEHLVEYYCVRHDGLPCRLTLAITQNKSVKQMHVQWIPDNPRSVDNILDVAPPVPAPRSPASRRKPSKGLTTQAKPPAVGEPLKLDPESIEIGYELGQGEYGSVLKGTWTSPEGKKVDVAIKTLHQQCMDTGREIFMREAEVMVKLDHPCIVQLIGVCQGPPIMLVQELMPLGSLLDYLLDYPERVSVETDLYLWAAQVACGMCYLEEQGFVHRDLAARNILLASKRQARVGDFGLSRAVEGTSNYYRASEGGRWPVKWYAPECVNYGTFSSASDVWSYGITLWEMFSFGLQPYGKMIGVQVIAHIERGGRLHQPEKCPASVHTIMQRCWAYKPELRPKFKELYNHFRRDSTVPDQVMRVIGYSTSSTSV